MTQAQAYRTVRNTFDDDRLTDDTIDAVFSAIYGRSPDEQDYEEGIWSMCCAATRGLCACRTRSQHTAMCKGA